MTETIWLCDLYRSSSLRRPFRDTKPGEPGEQDQIEVQLDPRAARSWKVMNGERFTREDLPSSFYKTMREDEYPKSKQFHSFPPAFFSNYVFVNEEIAAILREFNLGADALIPAELYLHDCVTKVDKPYYLLHFGVRKATIDRERSQMIRKAYESLEEYDVPTGITLPSSQERPEIIYHPEALEGPDMWVDPEFPSLIFFSDRLGTALKQAGVGRAMRLYPVNAPGS